MLTPRIMSISDRIVEAVGQLHDGEMVMVLISDEYTAANLKILDGGALLYEDSGDANLHGNTGDSEEAVSCPDSSLYDSPVIPSLPTADG